MIFTGICTAYYVASLENSMFYTCPYFAYELAPFNNWQCEINSIYIRQPHKLPFPAPFNEIKLSQAQIYAIIYGAFASLVAPFQGFMLSGLKRAYHVKDFAATLPGHGGTLDRFDCITLMCILSYFMMT